jgi:hypothetical protein
MRVCKREDFAGFENLYDEMGEVNWPYIWCPDDVSKLAVMGKIADMGIKGNSSVYLRILRCTKFFTPNCIEDDKKADDEFFSHFYFNLFHVSKVLDFQIYGNETTRYENNLVGFF